MTQRHPENALPSNRKVLNPVPFRSQTCVTDSAIAPSMEKLCGPFPRLEPMAKTGTLLDLCPSAQVISCTLVHFLICALRHMASFAGAMLVSQASACHPLQGPC